MLLVCRLPLLDDERDRHSDSDEEDEEELPAYEYRFETAKLLLEVDDTVDTALKVHGNNRVHCKPRRKRGGWRLRHLHRLHDGHPLLAFLSGGHRGHGRQHRACGVQHKSVWRAAQGGQRAQQMPWGRHQVGPGCTAASMSAPTCPPPNLTSCKEGNPWLDLTGGTAGLHG